MEMFMSSFMKTRLKGMYKLYVVNDKNKYKLCFE